MHDIYKKDCTLKANLCKRLNLEVLHPGNNKQSIPLALTIIHETKTAAIESYFSEKNNSADFLRLLNQDGQSFFFKKKIRGISKSFLGFFFKSQGHEKNFGGLLNECFKKTLDSN